MVEQIFAGVGLGVLTGLLVGLSASPVVASVVGAIAAGIVTLLGLAPGDGSRKMFAPGSTVRLGTFGLACALATLLGLYIRTHELLSPTPDQQIASLRKAGLNQEQATQWVLAKFFEPSGKVGVGSSVLFSGTGVDECQEFDPARYKDAREQLAHFQSIGGHYSAFATGIRSLSDSDKSIVLKGVRLLFCPE
jgi:hypothetical protein